MNFKTVLLSTLLALPLAACAPQSAHEHPNPSDEQVLFGQKVSSFARLDAAGKIAEIGVRLPFAALNNVSQKPDAVVLKLSPEVRQQSFFDHAVLFWNPDGLGPIQIPMFNIHFYGPTEAEVEKIDCADLTQPDPAIIPDGWLPPVAPGDSAKEQCVPKMGFHAGPADEDENAPFSTVMIAGFYAGHFNFIEPIFIKSLLEAKKNFELPVPAPKNLTRTVLHPKTFAATYDAKTDSYTFALRDFATLER
jgi:Domain of unknown function (DUF5602)